VCDERIRKLSAGGFLKMFARKIALMAAFLFCATWIVAQSTPSSGAPPAGSTGAAGQTQSPATATPPAGTATPPATTATPPAGTATPQSGTTTPQSGTATPQSGAAAPQSGSATPTAPSTVTGTNSPTSP